MEPLQAIIKETLSLLPVEEFGNPTSELLQPFLKKIRSRPFHYIVCSNGGYVFIIASEKHLSEVTINRDDSGAIRVSGTETNPSLSKKHGSKTATVVPFDYGYFLFASFSDWKSHLGG